MFHFRVMTVHGEPRTLHAPVQVNFDYTRSLGSVLSRFMTGLRERRILAGRTSDGRVVVPPPEFDPITHEPITELVQVAESGVVDSWAWVSQPVKHQPLDHPFAFALIRLDGADAPLLHAVDAPGPESMGTGMRVRARWAAETQGSITDIACFEPAPGVEPTPAADLDRDHLSNTPAPVDGPVAGIVVPVHLDYDYAASPEESRFYRGLAEGRILGQRCPRCRKVYVPPRGACPTDGVPTEEEVELPAKGTVTTFCVVNVPFQGQRIKPPYVSAYILLDGADIALQHLILDIEADQVRMGMRVEAVWKPREEWGTTIENIRHFRPTGEPDADYETYRQHL